MTVENPGVIAANNLLAALVVGLTGTVPVQSIIQLIDTFERMNVEMMPPGPELALLQQTVATHKRILEPLIGLM